MIFKPSPVIPEVIIIEPEIFEDNRGFFTEIYNQEKYEAAGIPGPFVQDNLSHSFRGVLRGLHYQLVKPQGKLVWALHGQIFDVAVDIRKNSSSFGKWVGITLSSENSFGLYIPPDFAHGFCVLSETAHVFYKCTDFYFPEHERCISWDDPELDINWPLNTPILSQKDTICIQLKDAQLPF